MLFDIDSPRMLDPGEFEALEAMAARVLTLVAPPAAAGARQQVSAALAEWGLTPVARRRLSAGAAGRPFAEEYYLAADRPSLTAERVRTLAQNCDVDLCLRPISDKRVGRRLLVFDMDSTLIQCEVIDELAARAGVGPEVAAVTARAMRGELDFRQSFRERMGKLRGLPAKELESVLRDLPVMPGARRLFRVLAEQGHHTAILSGGFDYFADWLAAELGISEVHANHLEIRDGELTGAVEGEIVDGERKARLLEEIRLREGISPEDTVAVGDGANDLLMLAAAGLGVAFHAKPLVRERAPCAVMHADLDALLYLMGVHEEP